MSCFFNNFFCAPTIRDPRQLNHDFITPDDVKYVAPPVLRHRILLRPDAEIEGLTPDQVVAGILASVPVPR